MRKSLTTLLVGVRGETPPLHGSRIGRVRWAGFGPSVSVSRDPHFRPTFRWRCQIWAFWGGLDWRTGRHANPVCHNFCRFVASCYHIFPTKQESARFEPVARPNAGKMCPRDFDCRNSRRQKKRAFWGRGSREQSHGNQENIKGNEARLRSLAGARCAKIALSAPVAS